MKKNALLPALILLPSLWAGAGVNTSWTFDLSASPATGSTSLDGSQGFSETEGFGWLEDRKNVLAVSLPEGNYAVTIIYDDAKAAAGASLKAEDRRLVVVPTVEQPGAVRSFAVNTRTPCIDDQTNVKLRGADDRESFTWDNCLTLEFFPDASSVKSIAIAPSEATTVYVAGDSTVTDQRAEPWAGWGMMLPAFFDEGVAISNHAESGRALYSFRSERRLAKILSTIREGDYLFIQFGHNDQKNKAEGSGPFTSYKADLADYVAKAREKKARPVIVTPMERRRWKDGEPQETLTDFAEAARQAGQELDVPVIDLHAMSLELYGALGEEESKAGFVHYPAGTYPGQDQTLKDDTHHNNFGAYELARCVVEGIRKELPELAEHVREGAGKFDPRRPDRPEWLDLPVSGGADLEKPEGN